MTFSDIFKSSFLNQVTTFSILDTAIALALSFVVGLFIYFVYRKTFNGVMYASSFGLSLVGLSLITTLVILAVSSNVILSLGMVGALSIVRFRAAIKEPMEIVYLFWAIAGGIVIGAGMIPLAVIGSVIIGVILILFANRKLHDNPYILIFNCQDEEAEEAAVQLLKEAAERMVVKAKTVNPAGIELTVELRIKEASTAFVNRICEIKGISDASLVSYNGEYMS